MVRISVQKKVGKYLTNLMDAEQTHFLGQEKYEHSNENTNPKMETIHADLYKRIGEMDTKVPMERNREFQTQILPRSKRYEDKIERTCHLMYPTRYA
jgi:putative transposase